MYDAIWNICASLALANMVLYFFCIPLFIDVCVWENIDGLVQECSNSSVLAMELLQSCTKPLI